MLILAPLDDIIDAVFYGVQALPAGQPRETLSGFGKTLLIIRPRELQFRSALEQLIERGYVRYPTETA